jgi:hypothetical protein
LYFIAIQNHELLQIQAQLHDCLQFALVAWYAVGARTGGTSAGGDRAMQASLKYVPYLA